MKITVLAKPNSKTEKVEKLPDGSFRVCVKTPPTEGKANSAIINALSSHFKIPKTSIELVHGVQGKKKIFEISGIF